MQSPIRTLALLVPGLAMLAACGGGSAANPWIGKTYLLDTPAVSPAHWVQPKGMGDYLGTLVPQFLIGVESGSGDDLDITLATALGGAQDLCNPTVQTTASGASRPDIQIAVSAFPMTITNTDPDHPGSAPTTVRDLSLVNVLPGDAPAKDGTLTATVDLADLYSIVWIIPNPTKDSVCQTLQSDLGVTCEVCASNQQPYCLTPQAVQIGATEVQTQIQKQSASDIPSTCP